jgi:hypothetical protein
MASLITGYEYDICLRNATTDKSSSATARKITNMSAGSLNL